MLLSLYHSMKQSGRFSHVINGYCRLCITIGAYFVSFRVCSYGLHFLLFMSKSGFFSSNLTYPTLIPPFRIICMSFWTKIEFPMHNCACVKEPAPVSCNLGLCTLHKHRRPHKSAGFTLHKRRSQFLHSLWAPQCLATIEIHDIENMGF